MLFKSGLTDSKWPLGGTSKIARDAIYGFSAWEHALILQKSSPLKLLARIGSYCTGMLPRGP